MRGMWKLITTTALLTLVLLAMVAAVSPEAATSALDSTMPVAIVQPLATMDGAPLVAIPRQNKSKPMLPESGMLVLVGTSLLGLAALVRRTT
jgi:hypothetical protein